MTKQEILSVSEIKQLVDSFYTKVRKDELLGPIFAEKIGDNWDEHLDKMYRFWETVLLNEHTYFGSPFPPHAKLPVQKQHFDKWLELFNKTIDEEFQGSKAMEAKSRAQKMAFMFQTKIDYLQNQKR
ncbi:group III truncated hemoglobin [Salibacter halophilus]|uniref:Group III truncated hemoglobin n=1 Tax=Salibacter halophilus TaxID=1803916 RepID=A0A6N6M4W9_9FLAO|nr:group III truncated hemoglobin [Salibacter halophilus]KAB1064425.1 group III truncated hemoglobin [Salibacter halophilus]